MNCTKKDMLLYAVTDRSWLRGHAMAQQVEAALQGGVTCVQLREKQLEDDAFLQEALQIKALCSAYGVPFLINDRVDIAIACGADGVHIGQKDMRVQDARAALGAEKIIGVSARTVAQAMAAQEAGADYLGVGAAFQTGTKLDANAIAHETMQAICQAVKIPVVAIGGITRDNILQLAGRGVDGVAVVSALFAQTEITAAAQQLRQLSTEMIQKCAQT